MWKRFEFDPEQAYQLVFVKNRDGSEKKERPYFYNQYLGCVCTFIEYDDFEYEDGRSSLWMYFRRDSKGNYINRNIHTSLVNHVVETENGLKIHTENSIYILEKTVLGHKELLDVANLIELYLSLDDNFYFCKGFYYDPEKNAHELYTSVHVGFMVDSCLIGTYEGRQWGNFVCRYFLGGEQIKFYDTLYHQQDYSTPMLIHNNGSGDMVVCFEGFPETWTIKPGKSRRIVPYSPEGADAGKEVDENGL